MKGTILIIGALLMWVAVPARAQQTCPDTCSTSGTCSNNPLVSCTSDAKCVAADIESQCPCDTASNHGQHQSCVVHLRNTLRRLNCPIAGIASCSARSTCGKPGRVLCCKITGSGTCTITTPGTPGTCSNDATVSCTADADCTVLSGPRITRDAATCTANGGYVSGTGSICAGCQAPIACCVPSTTPGVAGTCEILTAADCAAASGTSTPGAAPTCTGVTCP